MDSASKRYFTTVEHGKATLQGLNQTLHPVKSGLASFGKNILATAGNMAIGIGTPP